MFAAWSVNASADFRDQPDSLICTKAAESKGGVKVWTSKTYLRKYVVEAKKRGLACGIHFANHSDSQICRYAAYIANYGGKVWSSNNFRHYVIEAKQRGLNCCVIQTQFNSTSSYCTDLIRACASEVVCKRATTFTSGNKQVWLTDKTSDDFKYVLEAKKRGLICGVKLTNSEYAAIPCPSNMSACTEALVCKRATMVFKSKIIWEPKSGWSIYVNEAKRRGLSCDVGSNTSLTKPSKPTPVLKAPTKPAPVVKVPANPVPITKTPTQDDQTISASSGSGFAVSSDGYVITNNHVIESCQDVVVHTKQKDIPMRVITYDTQNDLALLKGNFTPSSVFPLTTNRPELLQDIYVAGYPFGINISTSVKVTKGIISSLTGIGNNFSNIQIDAALQSGNSGGPILDDMGNVVGVAVSKLDAKYMFENFGSIPENTNFGIKSSVVRSVLDSSSVDIPSANTSAISKAQLGKIITDGTYYINCWMTLAQIEKVRSKK